MLHHPKSHVYEKYFYILIQDTHICVCKSDKSKSIIVILQVINLNTYSYVRTYTIDILSHLPGIDSFLFIGHGDHSQHQVDQVEGAKENDNHEENHIPWSCCPNDLN